MPASYSAPMEPYLKRISGVDITHAGCGSSRKNFCQPMIPPATTSSTTMRRKIFPPVRFRRPAILPPLLIKDAVIIEMHRTIWPACHSRENGNPGFLSLYLDSRLPGVVTLSGLNVGSVENLSTRNSERFEILHQGIFLGGGDLCSVALTFMSLV